MSILNSGVKSWRDLPANEAIKYWKPSFYRNQEYQRRVNLAAILASTGSFACTYGTPEQDFTWIAGAGLLLSISPYTYFFIRPLNNQLLDTENAISKGEEWIRESLEDWKNRHSVRVIVSTALFGFMIYRFSKGF